MSDEDLAKWKDGTALVLASGKGVLSDEYNRIRKERDELREKLKVALEAMVKFGSHKGGCGVFAVRGRNDCTCGFSEALKQIGEH